ALITSPLPKFTALSHTWGYPGIYQGRYFEPPSHWNTPTHAVTCDGNPSFMVRTNLISALKTLFFGNRKFRREEYFWIDAICIDQENIAEKEDQVKLMGKIYGRADQVWAWLG
ncbi:heterokaryon incompatibility, partial [Rhypophila decipiens]